MNELKSHPNERNPKNMKIWLERLKTIDSYYIYLQDVSFLWVNHSNSKF